ncbi:MAG: hypothetical protein AB2792_03810 [Candidatus Thiodiazotropha sp.]
MTEKRSSDKAGTIPKKPPRRPARDYSSLPQRPITLKRINKKKSAGKTKKGRADTVSSTAPKRKIASKKSAIPRTKKQPPKQWLLKGINDATRQYAQAEAERQGVAIGEWLEQLILNHQQQASNASSVDSDQEEITETLHAIEQRLDRIEEQKGFWRRFWEQVMDQVKQD